MNICEDCDIELIRKDGSFVCMECGITSTEKIIYEETKGPDLMQTYNPYENKTGTFINGKNNLTRSQIRISSNYKGKSFNNVNNIISSKIVKYPEPVKDFSMLLWNEIVKSTQIHRAGIREGLFMCCIYYSCINFNIIKSPLEISNDFEYQNTDKFNKSLKIFKEIIGKSKKAYLLSKDINIDRTFLEYCIKLRSLFIIEDEYKFCLKCQKYYTDIENKMDDFVQKSIICGIIYKVCIENKIDIKKKKITELFSICSPTLLKVLNRIDEIKL